MPAFPLVDTHMHLWEPARTPIGWHQPGSPMARRYDVADYARDCGEVAVEAMVFVEAFVDRGGFEEEVRFVTEQADADPRIKAIVCQASVEDGRRVLDFVGPLRDRYPLVRGVRRLIEFDPDPDVCLRPGFIAGVSALGELGLTFDINIHHSQFPQALAFARQVKGTTMILDHLGKPGVKDGQLEPWRSQMRELARLPNVHCKLSDLPVEADWEAWTLDDVRPFVDAAVEAFGFDRLVFGGDWPVLLQASTLPRWVEVLDQALAGCTAEELRKVYRDNAVAFYRLDA